MAHLTFWYEFASTYSYLSAARIEQLAKERGVKVHWQPFLLGPIFQAQGWDTSPFNLYPAKGTYMWADMARQAKKYGLPPVQRPTPFPQNGLLAARLALLGRTDGWISGFSKAVFAAQFQAGKDISDPDVLAACLEALSLDAPALLDRARVDTDTKNRLRAATEDAQQRGLFGAPSFVTPDDTLFWGDDRLEDALDHARCL